MDLQQLLNQQLLIIESLDMLPSGKVRFGGKAGGYVDVEIENPIGKRRSVRARCGSDCPPGRVQLIKLDAGEYVAFSPSAARPQEAKSVERLSSKKQKLIKKEDGEFWPVTSCFLYFKVKATDELLDYNCAAQGDETSWDGLHSVWASPGGINTSGKPAYGFAMRADSLGDYATLNDAINNVLKPDRLIVPSGSPSASFARDNAVWGSGSPDAVMCWYYIGNPANAFQGGKIFKVSGPPAHPNAGNVTESGPGLCMEVYSQGSISAAIFPNEGMAQGPLTKELSKQFPDLGGSIGYAGRIEKWRAIDYFSTSSLQYFRDAPGVNDPYQTPTSFPSWYVPNPNNNPWLYTNATWFQFGWSDPTYIGCASTSWILAVKSNINAVDCAGSIPNNAWYWGGDAAPTIGRIDKDNPQGFIGTTGMYVCWAGHKENMGRAQSFFEAFQAYWGIAGSVTYLGSCNPYGCEINPPSGSYPPAPSVDTSRFPIECYGRKAEVFLRVEHQDFDLMEIKLPFEFAAVRTQRKVLGGGSFSNNSATFESAKIANEFWTFGTYASLDPYCLENPHATLTIVKRPDNRLYALVNIFYGAVRKWKEPLEYPIKPRLANYGLGTPSSGFYGSDFDYYRCAGNVSQLLFFVDGYYQYVGNGVPTHAILIGDYWHCCRFFEIRLPNKDDKTLTITKNIKYKFGENHQDLALEQPDNPDNEFNSKWLIADFRTDVRFEYIFPGNNYSPRHTPPSQDYASFGGLPGLIQFIDWNPNIINNFKQVFYKEKVDWTEMDWVYHHLMEAPRQFNPLSTVLPSGVIMRQGNTYLTNVFFDFDGRFGRHGRAEIIMPSADFGWNGSYNGGYAPAYHAAHSQTAFYPLVIAFGEQIRGNGLIENQLLTKWFRVSPSSWPSFGQLKRNNY